MVHGVFRNIEHVRPNDQRQDAEGEKPDQLV